MKCSLVAVVAYSDTVQASRAEDTQCQGSDDNVEDLEL